MPELNAVQNEISKISKDPNFIDQSDATELSLIHNFLKCHGSWYKAISTRRGWRITELNVVADEIRKYLGLPSVEDLNPELAKIKKSLKDKRGSFRKTMADLRMSLEKDPKT